MTPTRNESNLGSERRPILHENLQFQLFFRPFGDLQAGEFLRYICGNTFLT